jgi:hypothetical protein
MIKPTVRNLHSIVNSGGGWRKLPLFYAKARAHFSVRGSLSAFIIHFMHAQIHLWAPLVGGCSRVRARLPTVFIGKVLTRVKITVIIVALKCKGLFMADIKSNVQYIIN